MKLCLSTIALEPDRWGGNTREVGNTRLPALLPLVAQTEFKAVEVWQGHVLGLDAAGMKACRKQADELGLSLPVVGAYFQVSDPAAVPAQQAKADKLFAAAATFGSTLIKYFAGDLTYEKSTAAQQAAGRQLLAHLLKRADEYGLTLAAETHANTFTATEPGAAWWLAQAHSPRHKLLFQPVYNDTEGALGQWARQKPDVAYVHLAHVRAERGVDWRRLVAKIAADGYAGWSCLEFATNADPADPRATLRIAAEDAAWLRSSMERGEGA